MEFLLLYYVLLALWVPLLWPALRLRGWKRGALLVVSLAGALATANEVWQSFGTANNIRLDVLLFSVVLGMLYAAAVAVLLIARWRMVAILFGVVLGLTGGAMAYEWALVTEEGRRVRAKFDEGNELLFRAKFRDQATYDAYFGPFAGPSGRYPVGHWQALDASVFPRLIVNGEGRAWLFYRCGKSECAYAPADRGLERVADGAAREWRGLMRPPVGDLLPVQIVQDGDRVSAEFGGRLLAFTKTAPPLDSAPGRESLEFLGSYMSATCIRKHVAVRQLWLWRQRDRLFAAGVFQTLLPGHLARFVTPTLLGEGRRDGDAWVFDWKREGETSTASMKLEADAVSLTLTQARRSVETTALRPGKVFQDETIDLAPRTTAEDWKRWFGAVWTGHFFSGAAPACP